MALTWGTYYITANAGSTVKATKVPEWDGSDNDGVWTTAANWSTNTVPANAGIAIVSATSQTIATTDQSAVFLNALYIGDGFSGEITDLTINATKVGIRMTAGSVNLTGTFGHVIVYATGGGNQAVQFGATTKIDKLTIVGSSGWVVIDDSAFVDDIYLLPGPSRRAKLDVGSSVGSVSAIPAASSMMRSLRVGPRGHVDSESPAQTLKMSGTAIMDSMTADPGVTLTGGARLLCRGSAGDTTIYGGAQISFQRSTLATNAVASLTTYPGSTSNLRNGVDGVAVTTGITYRGGVVYVEPGQNIAVA